MLILRAGPSSLVLAPDTGGAILGWSHGARPVLRRALPDAILLGHVRGLAGFPLVPFCNRIACGRFHWDGQDYDLDRNFGDHPHTIHGVGWQAAWRVDAVTANSATISLLHDARGEQGRHWPFSFAAEQHIDLAEDALQVTLRMTNRHPDAVPAGLGLHPYFLRSTYRTMQFDAEGVWHNGANSLPIQHTAVPAAWDHSAGRTIGSVALDHCFTGWRGPVRLAGPAFGLELETSEIFRHLQVYTPPGQDFFCVEPTSHMPDAINHPGQPMHVLRPGESLSGKMTFRMVLSTPRV